ncbi:PulJ/GspJ family protein [Cellulomonas iranensis]|uniref:Type II secretory pathway pseudopilin PulG n=1 Tax=Cellulomonas iranensis TaxID=76862 RepID=A0ABU0GNW9_9CELL|nr:prepilin-type N-terminal cleavage/methylation domain-containing protein [Cellulomonas iranensis]MDQ0427069.1 type II secretory pathway pseudopilin PulG [Cellulomonas iranensis]
MTGGHGRDRDTTTSTRDAGITLVELIVSMGIFTVLVAVVMGGVVMMSRSTVRADVTVTANDGLRTAFQRLDRQVRYAEAVNFPGDGAQGRRYVEFRVSATVSATGRATCTQWRWDPTAGTLDRRSWEDCVGVAVPAFGTVVSDVQPPADGVTANYPFQLLKATEDNPRQRLVVRLRAGDSTLGNPVEQRTVFVARNSSTGSLTNSDTSTPGVSDIPVCMAGGRP